MCPLNTTFLSIVYNFVFVPAVLYFTSEGSDPTSHKLYATCSVTYLGAMVASNMALRYVSYPFQVLGKSCKPIPGNEWNSHSIYRYFTFKLYCRDNKRLM